MGEGRTRQLLNYLQMLLFNSSVSVILTSICLEFRKNLPAQKHAFLAGRSVVQGKHEVLCGICLLSLVEACCVFTFVSFLCETERQSQPLGLRVILNFH